MYADKMTDSMQRMINETNRRRQKQMAYNEVNNITPTQINKSMQDILGQTAVADVKGKIPRSYVNGKQ